MRINGKIAGNAFRRVMSETLKENKKMTYEEFKKKIEDIVQYETWYSYNGDEIILEYLEGLLARFNLKDERSYVIYYTNLKSLVDLTDDTAYKNIKELVEELVETPVKERVLDQKYYLKHRYLYDGRGYLYISKLNKSLGLGFKYYYQEYNNTFTEQEIENIKLKYNTDLNDFELIPVEEDKE